MGAENLLFKLRDALNTHDIETFVSCFDENYYSEQPVHPDRTFQGRVVRNAASLDAASRTMLVEVEVPNPDGILLPGMYSTVQFKLVNPSPPIVVADSSIIVLAEGPQIAVVDKDDVVHIRKVRLGRDFGRTVEILSGCNEGERIVTTPSALLKDGAKVRVQTAGPS